MSTPARITYRIRPARAHDCKAIAEMIRELAVYEKLEHEVKATAGELERQLFGDRPYAEAIVAESGAEPLGFALFFHSFSTFRCKPSLYLEDLFVRPAFRGHGVGKSLFAACARIAVDRECGRFEWAVLDWNKPAIGFYRSMGARPMDEWTVNRLDEQSLIAVAELAPQLSQE